MGGYVSVRGWLEINHEQREPAQRIIDAQGDDLYAGGWAFPNRPFNWSLYLFYGGDIREQGVGWLREQVGVLARMPPVDDDGDMPAGFFLLDHEDGTSWGWTVRDGRVTDGPTPAELRWFAGRP